MNFILTGRDALSRVLDRAGDASDRLGRRLLAASINGDAAMRRFTTNASRHLAGLERDTTAGAKAVDQLKKATLLLSPAAIPAAASLAPIAAGAGTVAVALGVMGAAMISQVSQISDASEAHKKYKDAVDKSGATSKEAVTAQLEYQRLVEKMPPATRRAAAAVSVLKDETREWSNDLAADTMAPFTKGVALTNALLPKTTDLVRGTASETDRFVTIIGGQMATPGFDRVTARFTDFSNRTLHRMNTELIELIRTSDSGEVGANARRFMDWARAQGPTVASVLQNVGTTLVNVLEAGSDVGVGLLQTIDVFTRLVSAVPPSAIAVFLQLAIAMKLTKLAALGMVAARTALASFGVQLVAMNTAAAAAPGRLAAVTAGIGALSRGAKVALAGTGIGLLIIGLSELASVGRSAPPDVDRLTTSLKNLAQTGQVTGELKNTFQDLDGLVDKVKKLQAESQRVKEAQEGAFGFRIPGLDDAADWIATKIDDMTKGGDSLNALKDDFTSLDQAMAQMVSNGYGKQAGQNFDTMKTAMRNAGISTKEINALFPKYRDAVAAVKVEQQLAAQGMGLFGQQAIATKTKLDEQKASADGLRQSLVALNNVQQQGLGGMIGFEASIDSAAQAAKENADALDMVNGRLDLNSPKAQAAATALNDLASRTDEAAASARESGASWETVSGIYSRGRGEFIKSAQAMGLTRAEAGQLADQILKIPDKKTRVTMDKEDAQKGLEAFNAAVRRSPGSKSVTLKTLSKGAESILESFGLKVRRLPNGKVTVTAATGTALSDIRNVSGALTSLNGKTATTYINTIHNEAYRSFRQGERDFTNKRARGGPINGPGTSTSDSIPTMLSDGEYVINAASTAKYRGLIEAINADRLGTGSGMGGAGSAVAAGLAGGMLAGLPTVTRGARQLASAVIAGMREELQISSPSKRAKALMADLGKGLIVGLTGSRDKIKATAKDLAKDIWAAFDGKKDNRLVAMVEKQTKRLLALASQRDKIAAKIKEAKEYASGLTSTARQQAGLSSLGMEEGEVTAGGIKGGLRSKLEQMRRFTSYVKTLASRGLSKSLLKQILDLGPEEGYAYASALAGADKATFNEINSLQKRINADSKSLGRIGADRLYDSGKNAGKGFLAGLASQEGSIKKLMARIAKSMQKALREALGISSPAKKLVPDGINTARGVAVGVLAGLPFIDRAIGAMAGRMVGRVASPGLAAVAGRPALTGPAGARTVHVQIDVHGATDPVAAAREIRRQLLELKRVHGVNINLGVG
jgi:hypothetical protein